MPDEGPLMALVITLVTVVVCPPGPTLVITIVVLENMVEPPTIGLDSEEVVVTGGLINWLDDTMGADDRSVVCPGCEERVEAKLDTILMLGGTALELDGMVDGKGDASDTEDYTIAEVGTKVAGCAGELDDMDERIIEEGTRVKVDTTTSFPDVNVPVTVVTLPGSNDVDMLVTAVLTDVCVLEAAESRAEEAGPKGVVRVIERPVRLGGAMLLSHSVEPLITE